MMTHKQTFARIALAIVIGLLLMSTLVFVGNLEPAGATAPTPVSVPSGRASVAGGPYYFMRESAKTEDGRGTTYSLKNYNIVDVFYTIDQGTVNTVTLNIQYSNDGVNWVTGGAIVSANAADATGLIQLNNYGMYTNVYADVANSNPVTITVSALGK